MARSGRRGRRGAYRRRRAELEALSRLRGARVGPDADFRAALRERLVSAAPSGPRDTPPSATTTPEDPRAAWEPRKADT